MRSCCQWIWPPPSPYVAVKLGEALPPPPLPPGLAYVSPKGKRSTILGVGTDVGVPLFILLGLGGLGLLLHLCRPAARRRRRERRSERAERGSRGRGKHVRVPTAEAAEESESSDDVA